MSTLKEEVLERRAAQAAVASCVLATAPTSALTLNLWSGEVWVLPWAQLSSAWLTGSEHDQQIEILFPQHRVIVGGRRLKIVVEAIAAFRVTAIRDFPPDYPHSASSSDAFVTKLTVEIREPAG